jgi:hypothetical protein
MSSLTCNAKTLSPRFTRANLGERVFLFERRIVLLKRGFVACADEPGNKATHHPDSAKDALWQNDGSRG